MRKTFLMLASITLVCACSGPMGPIAGGELEGTPTAWPEDWTFTDAIENVLLQTNPDDPYSVTVWMVVDDNAPYVAAASTDSRWARNMRNDSRVVLSVEGMLYEASAVTVTTRDDIDRVIRAYLDKYEIESTEDFVQEGGVLFRLQQR